MNIDTFNDGRPWSQNGAILQELETSVNRYKYQKSDGTQTTEPSQKILINPHFGKKVFVNPNFNPQPTLADNANPTNNPVMIHVNTKIYNPKFLQSSSKKTFVETHMQLPLNHSNKILVNPNIIAKNTKYLNEILQKRLLETEPSTTKGISHAQKVSIISKYSVVRSSNLIPSENKQRDIKSKYKIDKTTLLSKSMKSKYKLVKSPAIISGAVRKRRKSVISIHKIVKSSFNTSNLRRKLSNTKENKIVAVNAYKKDNRIISNMNNVFSESSNNTGRHYKRKFVFVNKFLSMSEVAKSTILKKNPNLKMSITNIKIGGVTYKNAPHSLKRTFSSETSIATKPAKLDLNDVRKSTHKLVKKNCTTKLGNNVIKKTRRLSERSFTVKEFKIVRKEKKSVSSKKLKKCNIPCQFYRKYGICKANEREKCPRKHDLDQIALCTRFLQGACIKENCRLSHRVLPEKMPTCKYYLEGLCSKDNCQYLHVKINPKADICRDFIEGYCKKAAKCEKRHQYLCPDYEKFGKCPKQRCEYPHGKMVRNYYLENKNKFAQKHLIAKKNSNNSKKLYEKVNKEFSNKNEDLNITESESSKDSKCRYYEEKDNIESNTENCAQNNIKDFKSRPKLGTLPAFIPFS